MEESPATSALKEAIKNKISGINTDKIALRMINAGADVNNPYIHTDGRHVTALNVFTNDIMAVNLRSKGARSMRDTYSLRKAINNNNIQDALTIIRTKRPLFSFRGTTGLSALSLAIDRNHAELIAPLMMYGAEIEETDYTNTVLDAARKGINIHTIKKMFELGASINKALKVAAITANSFTPNGILVSNFIIDIVTMDEAKKIERATILYNIGTETNNEYIKDLAISLGYRFPPVSVRVPTVNEDPTPPNLSLATNSSVLPTNSSVLPTNSSVLPSGDPTVGGSKKRRSTRRRKHRTSRKTKRA